MMVPQATKRKQTETDLLNHRKRDIDLCRRPICTDSYLY